MLTVVFNEIETYFMDNSIQPPQLPITGDGDKLSHLIEAEDEFSYYQLNQIYWKRSASRSISNRNFTS